MDVSTQLTYTGEMHCEAVTVDGKGTLPVDPAIRKGQPGQGYSPLDLLTLAHGTCLAMMMAKAATEASLDIRGMKVEMQMTLSDGPPMRVSAVRARFLLPHRFTPDQLARLQAGAKLCPVHTSLRPDIPVTLELVPPE